MIKKKVGSPKRGIKRTQVTMRFKNETIEELSDIQRKLYKSMNKELPRTKIIESLVKHADLSLTNTELLKIILDNG